MKRLSNLVLLILISQSCFTQIFDWGFDGYIDYSGGGVFTNIDNSLIDLTISGLANDNCYCTSDPVVITGINDQASTGTIHQYVFLFSEIVDVEFSIYDINGDSSVTECFYDYLTFTDSPAFSFPQDITITGDIITPLTTNSGAVLVKYSGVSGFTITHGNGVSCNPGYIMITSLVINDNQIVGNNENYYLTNSLSTLVNNELVLKNDNPELSAMSIVNYLGQNFKVIASGEEPVRVNTSDLPNGNYIFIIDRGDQGILRRKFIVVH